MKTGKFAREVGRVWGVKGWRMRSWGWEGGGGVGFSKPLLAVVSL